MSKKKKNKKVKPQINQGEMSPLKYITTGRARKLPIYECWINKNWEMDGLRSLVVARRHTTGNITYGIYLIDSYCLGLKSTTYRFNHPVFEYEPFVDRIFSRHMSGKEKIDYVLAHNMIYGAIAYAEDLGFKPDKDWKYTEYILEEDTEDIELIELEFGKNGKPVFINGPYDNVGLITSKLDKAVGKGNYEVTMIGGLGSNLWLDDEDFEEGYDDDEDDFEEGDDAEDTDYEEVK